MPAKPADPPGQSPIENRQRKMPSIPSRTWRELIKKAWDVDPLLCPKCGSQMRLISLIQDDPTIERIHKGTGH
jgi:hypothetical protein